jgi:N-terminal domain of anti-restriction factor ArdC
VQTGLRPPSIAFRVGNPPLALAAPAGVGQGQGVSEEQPQPSHFKAGENIVKKTAKTTQPNAIKTSNNLIQGDNSIAAPAVMAAPYKQQTAKEAIAANVQLLIEQLEQGHSESLTAYLTAMGKFHRYSFGNILEIAIQKPSATHVAGMCKWNQLGRRVKKGEKGIRILAPIIGTRRKKDAEADKDSRTQNQPVLVGFRSAWVWDISSTEGRDLPELSSQVTGDVGVYRQRLMDFVIAQGITLEFKDSIAPALGMCYGDRIVLLPGQSPAEEFSTLVHELAHSFLHRAERRIATTKTVRETEAEAIAFVVGTTIGLDSGRNSADYIALYHGDAALLAESLEVIQKTSALILSALENNTAEATAAAELEAAPDYDGTSRTEALDILRKIA